VAVKSILPNLSGAADLTAALLTRGTTTRSATQIAEAIEAWVVLLIRERAGTRRQSVSMSCPRGLDRRWKSSPMWFAIRPSRRGDRPAQTTVSQQSESVLGSAGGHCSFAAARVVYRDAPYGHPLSGTPESLPRIKRDDITKLHGMFYRPDNAILVIGGDITPENGFAIAQKYFGDWQSRRPICPRWQ